MDLALKVEDEAFADSFRAWLTEHLQRPPAFVDLALHEAIGLLNGIGGVVFGLDRLPAGRQLVDHGDVQIAIERHG